MKQSKPCATFKRVDMGFTLLEIIVAVAIFGVIASIAFPAMIQFLDARDRVIIKNERLVDLQKTYLLLDNDLNFAFARTSKTQYGELGKNLLYSESDALFEVVSAIPDPITGQAVPKKIAWYFDDGKLQRRSYQSSDPSSGSRLATITLLDGVESVDLVYQYIEDGKASESNNWRDKATQLPSVIKVSITMEDDAEYVKQIALPPSDFDSQKLQSVLAAASQSNNASGAPTPAGGSANAPAGAGTPGNSVAPNRAPNPNAPDSQTPNN